MPAILPLQPDDALLIVDVQNDFLPGGALGVPQGDEVVPVLNRYISHFAQRQLPVFATRDWHPEDHCSFRAQGGPWPPHCVMHTPGADFAVDLRLPTRVTVVSKGSSPEREAYSGFADTGLESRLHTAGVRRLFVGGLATDYCVLNTVRDARAQGFDVCLLRDAVRAVNVAADDGAKAEAEMQQLGAVPLQVEWLESGNPAESALLTDLYELTMLQAYAAENMEATAVFEFFVRGLPADRNFLVAAGLEQVLEFLENLRFSPAELAWLESTGKFTYDFIHYLSRLRFTGDVHAIPEGTVFFPHEPILRVTAPMPQAQLIETRVVNLLQLQTMIASKAVRSVIAAPGKTLVDFGLRRAHGAEAGLLAARASYLAGFSATSNVLAGRQFGIPLSGTMAHSFVQACDSEEDSFLRFARANRDNVVFLLDTYDTEAAAQKVVRLAPQLHAEDITIRGVRLDSGDLTKHARRVRGLLDRAGLGDVRIFASGSIDEYELERLVAAAPIDGFGVGTHLVTSSDAPYLDCVYKLQEYAGRARRKRSEGKATWPGRKQVYRHHDVHGRMRSDVVTLDSDPVPGEPLLEPVMRNGRRLAPGPSLFSIRDYLTRQLGQLPPALLTLKRTEPYPVMISETLHHLAGQLNTSLAEP